MTNEELIAKIKVEIERRIHNIENCPFIEAEFGASEKRDGKLTAYKELLSFISTIEKLEKSVPKDLEEAADKYEKENTGIYPEVGQTSIRDAFIDGVEWQKEQDDRFVNIIYQQGIEKGKDDMKEQMLKDAICGNAYPDDKEIWCNLDRFPELEEGDKVKVIIVKKENE